MSACSDINQRVSRHFGPKTFRHHQTGAEMIGQFGTSAEVSRGHFGTGTELSRPQQTFLLQLAILKKGLVLLVIIIKEDRWFTQEYTAED